MIHNSVCKKAIYQHDSLPAMMLCQRWEIAFENLDVSTMQKRRDSVGNDTCDKSLQAEIAFLVALG
jgi:hypothetical protein